MVTNILILSKANGISYNLVNIMTTKKTDIILDVSRTFLIKVCKYEYRWKG